MAYFHKILQPLALLGLVFLPSEAILCYSCEGDAAANCTNIVNCGSHQTRCVTISIDGVKASHLSCGGHSGTECPRIVRCCNQHLCNGQGLSGQHGSLECHACQGYANSTCNENPEKARVQRCDSTQNTCLTLTGKINGAQGVVRSCGIRNAACGWTHEGLKMDCCDENKCNSANSCQQNQGQLVFGLLLAVTAVFMKY